MREDLDEGKSGRRGQRRIKIAQAEENGDKHAYSKTSIDNDGRNHAVRNDGCRIFNFLRFKLGKLVSSLLDLRKPKSWKAEIQGTRKTHPYG